MSVVTPCDNEEASVDEPQASCMESRVSSPLSLMNQPEDVL
jgi:hypothetical protein